MPEFTLRTVDYTNLMKRRIQLMRREGGGSIADHMLARGDKINQMRANLLQEYENAMNIQPPNGEIYDAAHIFAIQRNIHKQYQKKFNTINDANDVYCRAAERCVDLFLENIKTLPPETNIEPDIIDKLMLAPPQGKLSDDAYQILADTFEMEPEELRNYCNGVEELSRKSHLDFENTTSELDGRDKRLYKGYLDDMILEHNADCYLTTNMQNSYQDEQFIIAAKKAQWQKDNPNAKTEPSAKDIADINISKCESITTPNNVKFNKQGNSWVLDQSVEPFKFKQESRGTITQNHGRQEMTAAYIKLISAMKSEGITDFTCKSRDPRHLKAFRDAAALSGIDSNKVHLYHKNRHQTGLKISARRQYDTKLEEKRSSLEHRGFGARVLNKGRSKKSVHNKKMRKLTSKYLGDVNHLRHEQVKPKPTNDPTIQKPDEPKAEETGVRMTMKR